MNGTDTPAGPLGAVRLLPDGRSQVVFERHLPHPVERVWQAITDPAELARWMPEIELDPQAGGVFRMWFSNEAHEGPPDVTGNIEVWDPPHRLKLGSCSYELSATDEGCLLVFTDILYFVGPRSNEDIANSVLAGWHAFIDTLQAALEADGRVDRVAEVDYASQDVPTRSLVNQSPRND